MEAALPVDKEMKDDSKEVDLFSQVLQNSFFLNDRQYIVCKY